MKQITAVIAIAFSCFSQNAFAQKNISVSPEDLKPAIGCFKGSLTYLDYQSGKPYTMPADLKIRQAEDPSLFVFSNIYPDEPKANSSDSIRISADGRMLNNERIISKAKNKWADLEIITEENGTDGNDNKPAVFRHTYTIGKAVFINKKEVQFTGQSNWIKRHEYMYAKTACR